MPTGEAIGLLIAGGILWSLLSGPIRERNWLLVGVIVVVFIVAPAIYLAVSP